MFTNEKISILRIPNIIMFAYVLVRMKKKSEWDEIDIR